MTLDKVGRVVPPAVLPLWDRRQEALDMLSAVSRVKCALEHARDDSDPFYAEVNYNNVLGLLDNAYGLLKVAVPYAVCPGCQGKLKDKCMLCKGRGYISEFRWDTAVPKTLKAKIVSK